MQQEQAIKLAAKLYECRDTAKRLLGDGYQARMDAYGQIIKSTAMTTGTSEMSAAIACANRLGGLPAVYYLAAAVEIAEPSNTKSTGEIRCQSTT